MGSVARFLGHRRFRTAAAGHQLVVRQARRGLPGRDSGQHAGGFGTARGGQGRSGQDAAGEPGTTVEDPAEFLRDHHGLDRAEAESAAVRRHQRRGQPEFAGQAAPARLIRRLVLLQRQPQLVVSVVPAQVCLQSGREVLLFGRENEKLGKLLGCARLGAGPGSRVSVMPVSLVPRMSRAVRCAAGSRRRQTGARLASRSAIRAMGPTRQISSIRLFGTAAVASRV